MVSILDILIPEIVIIINILYGTFLPLIFSKLAVVNNFKPNLSSSFHIFSILMCILALAFAYNTISTNSFFGFSYYINALIYIAKLLILIFAIITLSLSFFHATKPYEVVLIMLGGILGALFMTSGGDYLIIYLGLELLSISTYILLASDTTNRRSINASIKYTLLSLLSSSFILLGISLIYGYYGTTSLYIPYYFNFDTNGYSTLFYLAHFFIFIGFSFKLGLFPFHSWVPDIYEGAPIYSVAYITLIPKTAYISFIISLITQYQYFTFSQFFSTICIFSIVYSSIAALNQTSFLRVLGYSSINNMGICILPLVIGDSISILACFFYLFIYLLLNTIIFAIITIVKIPTIYDINRILKYPFIAFAFTLTIFSLAGVPPLAGFFGKFFILTSLFAQELYFFGAIVLIFSAISAFFYVRLIANLFFNLPVLFDSTTTAQFNFTLIYFFTFINLFFPLFLNFFYNDANLNLIDSVINN